MDNMRYTRYNYKPKKSKMLLSIVVIMGLSIVFGSFIFDLLFKVPNEKNDKIQINDNRLYAIQCGVFEKRENASKYYTELSEGYTKFILEENKINKILIGIYEKEQIDNIQKELNDKKVNNIIIELKIGNTDIYNAVKAYMQVAEKTMDKKIKSVNTSGLKKWIQENIKDEHLTTSEKEIIMLINSLPEEYTKSEVEKDLIQLYTLLRKNYN